MTTDHRTKPESQGVRYRDLRPKSRAEELEARRRNTERVKSERRQAAARETANDLEAARALEDAGGICERCEEQSPALMASRERGGAFAVECLDRTGCSQRIYRQVTA